MIRYSCGSQVQPGSCCRSGISSSKRRQDQRNAMGGPHSKDSRRVTRFEGDEPFEFPWNGAPEGWEPEPIELGFECASGDWKEREWTGLPVLDLVATADVPGETTHVQFEGANGEQACIPLADLEDAIIAVGDDEEFPRFVSRHVLGPRTIKTLTRVRPLSLAAGEDRADHEDLPLEEE